MGKKMTIANEITTALKQIDISKKIIAKEHDKLREVADELEILLESFDGGLTDIGSGMDEIQNGIDKLSEQV